MNYLKITLSILTVSLFLSCGGNQETEQASSDENQMTSKEIMQKEAEKKEKTEVTEEEEIIKIVIEADDQMQYNLDEMTVKAGSTVELTLKHVGQLPKDQMGHNWVLLKPEASIMQFSQKASSAKDNDYIPESLADQVIANTKMLGGGEEATITFEAPEKGTYDFICSFPGHAMIMQGKFIVE
ncbi:azurin [Marivirga arenosa]|uniref:Azurin n=1 Tax=Marivirga arenosa TaxID=3059076 RepID=A0AA49GJ10_9BACT|nr:azurin [Marivirga sp. BKB1-2]WKK80994.2 azurin [Marivirga sp. BKB1-2]